MKRTLVNLKDWCAVLEPKIHTLYMHYADGTIIGRLTVAKAIEDYGDSIVTNAYYEGDGLLSVWIV